MLMASRIEIKPRSPRKAAQPRRIVVGTYTDIISSCYACPRSWPALKLIRSSRARSHLVGAKREEAGMAVDCFRVQSPELDVRHPEEREH